MNRVFTFIAVYLVACGCAVGAERVTITYLNPRYYFVPEKLTGPARVILEARQISETLVLVNGCRPA